MKKRLSLIAGVFALVATSFVGMSVQSTALAQKNSDAPVILIVSRAQIIQQSKAGKTIPDQAASVRDAVAKELEQEQNKLQKEIEDFQKNASLMSEDVRKQKEQELSYKAQSLPQRAQIMEQAFTGVVQKAQAKILVEAQPILKKIVEKRGATILLDRDTVMYASPETDVTQEVLAALDKKVKTVEVEKITLADVEKRLADAIRAQQEAAKK